MGFGDAHRCFKLPPIQCRPAWLDSKRPVEVAGGHQWLHLSAGGLHTCGITTDNGTWCWGSNSAGQLVRSSARVVVCASTCMGLFEPRMQHAARLTGHFCGAGKRPGAIHPPQLHCPAQGRAWRRFCASDCQLGHDIWHYWQRHTATGHRS